MSSGNRLKRIRSLTGSLDAPLYTVHGPTEIASALADAAPTPEDRVIIIGGDGTLQAAVSALAAAAGKGEAPTLCMLGGGRTNFTARDLGSHQRLLGSVERLIVEPEAWTTVERRVLRIVGPEHGILFGFFMAGALVDTIIRDTHAYRARHRSRLHSSMAATQWRLAQLAILGLSGRMRMDLPDLEIQAPSLGRISGRVRILLVSSLRHEGGGLDPYADRGEGDVRVTAILERAEAFWRRLPGLLTGRFGPLLAPETGYLSGRTPSLEIMGLASICLDGQEYGLDPAHTLEITAGPAFRFLKP